MTPEVFTIWTPAPEELSLQRAWIETQVEQIGVEKILQMVFLAGKARENAYTTYSHYNVGAALLTESGEIYTGCNNENVNYTNTGHAETGAITKAISSGEAKNNRRFIRALCVVTNSDDPSGPCHSCRQSLAEHADNALIIEANDKGEVKFITSLQLLSPKSFTPTQLGIE